MILGIGAGDRPLLALGMRPARLASVRSAIGAIRALWSGGHVTIEDPAFELHDAHLRFEARADIPDLRLGERPEDPRARRRDRRRRDPARRTVPRGALLGPRARRSRRREGGPTAASRGGVRVRCDRRRRAGGPGLGSLDRGLVPADRPRRSASSPACRRRSIEQVRERYAGGEFQEAAGSGTPAPGRVRAEGRAGRRRSAGAGADRGGGGRGRGLGPRVPARGEPDARRSRRFSRCFAEVSEGAAR